MAMAANPVPTDLAHRVCGDADRPGEKHEQIARRDADGMREGDRLSFLLTAGETAAVLVELKASLRADYPWRAARPLFATHPRPMVTLGDYPYDVSADGQRFLVNTVVDETASTAITLVVNWTAGLKK